MLIWQQHERRCTLAQMPINMQAAQYSIFFLFCFYNDLIISKVVILWFSQSISPTNVFSIVSTPPRLIAVWHKQLINHDNRMALFSLTEIIRKSTHFN